MGQQQLISAAFAGDDVEAAFEAEKAAGVAAELPVVDEPSTLPGWGMWAGSQREPKWMRDAKAAAAEKRAAAAGARKDAGRRNVVISEKWDKKAQKFTAEAAPYPFTSREVYEASMRQPLGRQFNPDSSFRDLTRPAVLKATGSVITPARYSSAMSAAAAGGGTTDARGVTTIAGGMPVLTKAAGQPKPKKGGKDKGRASR
uniref:Uncharacterized protein n=1 Tax=Chlamydomonas euryale TaxID=1486919 RepID=A0A7R9VFW6_9CHLO